MILNSIEKKSLVDTLSWMVKDRIYNHNQIRGNLEEGSQGGYSPELKKAIQVLEYVKTIEPSIGLDQHKKSIALNCREFRCGNNKKGVCHQEKITLMSADFPIVGTLKCAEACKSSELHLSKQWQKENEGEVS